MHSPKAAAGKKAEDPGHEKKKNGRECSPFDSFHGLLYQEEPEEKKRQDKSGPGLAPGFFLAEEMPEEMKAQV
jgi:hypothetical protein